MKKIIGIIYSFTLLYLNVTILLLTSQMSTYAQEGSYSKMAQSILDNQNAINTDGASDIDVFKFSVNDVLNSLGETVENGLVCRGQGCER